LFLAGAIRSLWMSLPPFRCPNKNAPAGFNERREAVKLLPHLLPQSRISIPLNVNLDVNY
jgi:hypothetical protein